ncbi:MAG: hypothetical protein ACJ76H_13170 [Bacteriovoracaceae bacterium]
MLKALSFFLLIQFAHAFTISEEDLAYQKKVMDQYADAGIVLAINPGRTREQWEKIASAKDAIMSVFQGQIDIVKEGAVGIYKIDRALFIPSFDYPGLTVEKLRDVSVNERAGETIKEMHFIDPSRATDSRPPDFNVYVNPVTQWKTRLIFSSSEIRVLPDNPLNQEQVELRFPLQGKQKGLLLRGFGWGKLYAFLPGEMDGLRFIITKFDPGNPPQTRKIIDLKVVTVPSAISHPEKK